jgi:hypothetical protein
MKTTTALADLKALRTTFGLRAAARKLRALVRLRDAMFADWRGCIECHEALLFVCCYPDNHDVLNAAEAALRRLGDAVGGVGRPAGRTVLTDTGIENSVNLCALSYEAVCWLARTFPKDVDLSWEHTHCADALDALLRLIVEPVEGDSLLHDAHDIPSWIDAARGDRTALAWLLERVGEVPASEAVRERLFDACALHVRWRLRGRRASRTHLRFPKRAIAYQKQPIERGAHLGSILAMPLPGVRRLPVSEAESLMDTARAVLAVRHRETDPVTYANPHEVTLVTLEDGIDVALFGMRPDRRLPIESFFGYVVARNRVPIGYGGGWVFFDRCEIGVNVFDTFRGGANAAIFANILRVYRHHYGVRRFAVDPFQFGADNPEAIRSGAFWFYYRLGFRPTDPAARRIAERQSALLVADPSHRTPRATLRRLAESPLEYTVSAVSTTARPRREMPPGPDLPELGLAVTRWIATRFGGDRSAARREAVTLVNAKLGVGESSKWPPEQRSAFENMSLLIAQIDDLEAWGQSQKRALAQLVRAKGGRRERDYARGLRRLPRLRAALNRLAAGGR